MQCFYTDSKDRLRQDFVPIEDCDSYVVFTVSEFESINLLLNGGFSAEAFSIGFGGIVSLWIIGLTSGIIISIMRKANK
jgi:hypothetical protein